MGSTRPCAPSAPSAARRGSWRRGQGPGSPTSTAALRRPGLLVGADDPRPRAPRRPRGRAARRRRAASRSARRSENEVALAEEIVARVEPVEQVRLVNSGTEATMTAIRLARGFTGRDGRREVRRLLPRPRRRAAGLGRLGRRDLRPAGLGRRAGRARPPRRSCCPTTTSPPSRPPSPARGHEIAAVITEAAAGNMGVVPPRPGFTEALRRVTRAHGALLVSDEVMTGFRVLAARAGTASRARTTPGRPTCSPSAR